MDNLQWFKFSISNWVIGRIQKCPEITQARFMRLICLYWSKECMLSIEDAEIEIDKEHLDILLSKKVVKINEDFISIDFLNEQFEEILNTSQKRREAVQKRWSKVKQNDTSVSENNTSVLQNDTEKSKSTELEEKKEENKSNINNILLSEIKISDDQNFLEFGKHKFEIEKSDLINFKTAVWFQKLFIKNLKEKESPTSNQENAKYKNYVTPIRLMFDNDKVTHEQAKQAYDFLNSLEGEFWKKNILSTEALRKNIQKLLIQKNSSNGITKPQFTGHTKKPARFSIARAEQTLLADAERKRAEMENRNSGS